MLPLDKGNRDLLPPIEADPAEIVGPEMAFVGSFAPAVAFPLPATPSAMQPAADLPPDEQDAHGQPATIPIKGPASSIAASNGSEALGGEAEWADFIPISVAENFPVPITHRGGVRGPDHRQDGQDGRRELDGDDDRGGVNHRPSDVHGGFTGIDDVHSINVTQIALVDQDAGIIVNGYVGEVVARLHIDQDLMMDQDVDIAFTIDGDGHFVVLVDQDMRIDQEIEIDIKIFDVDGVLYVDLFLRDSIEVEQNTSIDMRISDGPRGGTVEVNQNIELDQDVDIDIDIEDELEERYIIEVNVSVLQEVDADQDAVVDIRDWNGEIDMDVDAMQTATVDQQTIVQADFALA